VGAYTKKSSDVRILSELYKAAGRVEAVMIRHSTILVVLFGFLQGANQNWLLVANLMILMAPFPILFFFLPRGKILRRSCSMRWREGRSRLSYGRSFTIPR
jgi:hypothetical protein